MMTMMIFLCINHYTKEFDPIMIIVYENKDVKKIDDLTEMKKFIQKLQK
jgi:hypothetical protein